MLLINKYKKQTRLDKPNSNKMAKVIITIEDIEGKEGAISMNYEFNPELPQESGAEEQILLTPAQTMAMYCHNFMQDAAKTGNEEQTSSEAEGSAEEDCTQEGEDTCCGGDCQSVSAEA